MEDKNIVPKSAMQQMNEDLIKLHNHKKKVEIKKIDLYINYFNVTPQIHNKIVDLLFKINKEFLNDVNVYCCHEDINEKDQYFINKRPPYQREDNNDEITIITEHNLVKLLKNMPPTPSFYEFKNNNQNLKNHLIEEITNKIMDASKNLYSSILPFGIYKDVLNFIENQEDIFDFTKKIDPFEIHLVNVPNFERISNIESSIKNYKKNIEKNGANIKRFYIPTLSSNEMIKFKGTLEEFNAKLY